MTNINALVTDNIDIWTSAIKTQSTSGRGSRKNLELTGIKKLRELILELAVRGKLVPQDPDDEPAFVLLDKMSAEKEQLYQDKKIKKPKKLPEISKSEKLFQLPTGWSYSRLNELGEWGAGSTPKRSNLEYYGGDIPWFKSGELVADYILKSEETVTELALKESSLRYNNIGDVLLAMYGATIGKTAILNVPATTNQAVCACTTFSGFENIYLLTLLKAYRHRFIGMGAGGAQPNISREKIIATVILLPPTAEQHRIVTKVDELMVLCDQLEQQSEKSITAHQTLVDTLLDALVNPEQDATAFADSWALIEQHFELLFTTEQSIDKLKQTILQLAVMGKLVPQDPNYEPASVLLENIAAEKERLVKEKKIKKQKALPEITEDEKMGILPNSWEWARLGSFSIIGTGATPLKGNTDYYSPEEVNWVTSGATGDDYIFSTTEKISMKAVNETNVSIYPIGTLIIAMYGQGKTRGQISELMVEAGTNQACASIQLYNKDTGKHVFIAVNLIRSLMQTKEILSHLKFYNKEKFPLKALQAAVNQQEEITPHLLAILQDCIDNTQQYLDSQNLMWHTYAVFLLAQFREQAAYPLIVKLLRKNGEIPFELFGDAVTEDMDAILAAVCHGDLTLIKQLIEDETVNEYVRTNALDALLVLYAEDDLDRYSIIEYLNTLFQKITRKKHYIWCGLVSTSIGIGATGLMNVIQAAFDEELLEEGVIDLDDVKNSLQQYDGDENDDEDELKVKLLKYHRCYYPKDIIEDIQKWACFNTSVQAVQPTKKEKTGRNAPCPCGSGKKFKKCCLN